MGDPIYKGSSLIFHLTLSYFFSVYFSCQFCQILEIEHFTFESTNLKALSSVFVYPIIWK